MNYWRDNSSMKFRLKAHRSKADADTNPFAGREFIEWHFDKISDAKNFLVGHGRLTRRRNDRPFIYDIYCGECSHNGTRRYLCEHILDELQKNEL